MDEAVETDDDTDGRAGGGRGRSGWESGLRRDEIDSGFAREESVRSGIEGKEGREEADGGRSGGARSHMPGGGGFVCVSVNSFFQNFLFIS